MAVVVRLQSCRKQAQRSRISKYGDGLGFKAPGQESQYLQFHPSVVWFMVVLMKTLARNDQMTVMGMVQFVFVVVLSLPSVRLLLRYCYHGLLGHKHRISLRVVVVAQRQ